MICGKKQSSRDKYVPDQGQLPNHYQKPTSFTVLLVYSTLENSHAHL
ncbi:hypothetical protein HMPREF1979_00111 [Actinomyces johnsonii F0542]|uniref:Uncharacterized protein n=1 Tax=Actinomyces johnsonii F0542 TaxID=1321818 RepID=U1QWM6_9ACTO|nr:hypothetical protein HMPREF1979_00111 [Actinomyces johnsonii F0542]